MRSIESRPTSYPDTPVPFDTGSVTARPPRRGRVPLDSRLAGPILAALRLADGAVLLAGGLFTAAAAGLGADAPAPFPPPFPALFPALFPVGFAALLSVDVFQACRLYAPRALAADWKALFAGPILLAAVLLGLPALAGLSGGGGAPWPWLLHWTALGAVWLLVSRGALAAALPVLLRSRSLSRHVLVVGEAERAQAVADLLSGQGLTLTVGRPDDLREDLRRGRHDDVIVALPWRDDAQTQAVLAILREYPVDVHLFPEDPRPLHAAQGLGVLAGIPMPTLSSRPLSLLGTWVKAAEDRLLALLIVALISPLLLGIALAIRLDSPGPVLFRQKRYGFNNEVFVVFKFRSMFVQAPGPDLEQARRQDPRVTRVGRFLRRSSLDELPQLFNVLAGDMSLVGPRPHAIEHQNHYQHLVDEYRCRHRMRPGITGWAQVNGYRGETATVELMRKRVEYDLYYIEHWSLLLDLWILLLTPFACLWGKNAY